MSKKMLCVGRLTDAICSDCDKRIFAFNDLAAELLIDAYQRGVVVRCITCQTAENNKRDLLNSKLFAELPY